MNRILFLDVTGVLNSQEDCGSNGLGESHLLHLKRIVEETGCNIVLTSSWRLADDLTETLRRAFVRFHIPIWIDSTPDLSSDRAEEIQAWIERNGPCYGVVLDDDCEEIELPFVQTTVEHGVNEDRATEVISAFNRR